MIGYFFKTYFYRDHLETLIDQIEKNRQERRQVGLTMNSTFAQDMKNALHGNYVHVLD